MGTITCSEQDIKSAACYFIEYTKYRDFFLKGHLDKDEFEDYMSFRESKMSEKACDIAEIMAQGLAEEMKKKMNPKNKMKNQAEMMKFLYEKYCDMKKAALAAFSLDNLCKNVFVGDGRS